jgi:hypothetical protein
MGVGRNLAYKEKNFFKKWIHQPYSGSLRDDDLFINEATATNTIVYTPQSFTIKPHTKYASGFTKEYLQT